MSICLLYCKLAKCKLAYKPQNNWATLVNRIFLANSFIGGVAVQIKKALVTTSPAAWKLFLDVTISELRVTLASLCALYFI